MSEADFPYTNIFVQYCAVLYIIVLCLISWSKNICVVKIGFGNEQKKLRWGLSTRVLNFVRGIKNHTQQTLVRFPGVGLEKPNPARTIDTLADGS